MPSLTLNDSLEEMTIIQKIRLLLVAVIILLIVAIKNPVYQPIIFYALFCSLLLLEARYALKSEEGKGRLIRFFPISCFALVAIGYSWAATVAHDPENLKGGAAQALGEQYSVMITLAMIAWVTIIPAIIGYFIYTIAACFRMLPKPEEANAEPDGSGQLR